MFRIVILFFSTFYFLSGCTAITPKSSAPAHDSMAKKQSNSKVLNCVRESGHHVYRDEVTCPLGGGKFKTLRLGTHSTYGRHLDWEPISYMRFPVPLPVCPGSGFVMAERNYSDKQLKKLKVVVESAKYQKYYKQNHASYFLYAKTLELLGEQSKDQWWLYLNATWEAGNCGNKERYKEYADNVIKEGRKKLGTLKPDSQEFWVINIVVANMYRKTGQFETAREYLKKIGTPDLKDKKSSEYFVLAKRLLAESIEAKVTDRVAIKEEKK